MTDAQRQLLNAPAIGLIIYNISTNDINFWNGSGWQSVNSNIVSTTSASGKGPGGGTGVNFTGATADSSAMLDVFSTDKGLLIPRTKTNLITTTLTGIGLIIYNTATNEINYWDGIKWRVPCYQLIDNKTGGIVPSAAGGISIDTTSAGTDPSAILDIASGTKGMLIPRMTNAERDAINSPAQGLIIFNTTDSLIENWNGSGWYATMSKAIAPTAGINIPSANSIVWNWVAVNGAAGYKYGTVSIYNDAIDLGTNTSYSQTGLSCLTADTLFVWAYNSCGNSSYTTLTQTTTSCCGGIISTIAGNGASWL